MTEQEIRDKELEIRSRLRAEAPSKYKDTGTCVIGMKLVYKNRPIAGQIWQGCTPNYQYFKELKETLIAELGYEAKDFYVDDGNMD